MADYSGACPSGFHTGVQIVAPEIQQAHSTLDVEVYHHLLRNVLGFGLTSPPALALAMEGIDSVIDLITLEEDFFPSLVFYLKTEEGAPTEPPEFLPPGDVLKLQLFVCFARKLYQDNGGVPLSMAQWMDVTQEQFNDFCFVSNKKSLPTTPTVARPLDLSGPYDLFMGRSSLPWTNPCHRSPPASPSSSYALPYPSWDYWHHPGLLLPSPVHSPEPLIMGEQFVNGNNSLYLDSPSSPCVLIKVEDGLHPGTPILNQKDAAIASLTSDEHSITVPFGDDHLLLDPLVGESTSKGISDIDIQVHEGACPVIVPSGIQSEPTFQAPDHKDTPSFSSFNSSFMVPGNKIAGDASLQTVEVATIAPVSKKPLWDQLEVLGHPHMGEHVFKPVCKYSSCASSLQETTVLPSSGRSFVITPQEDDLSLNGAIQKSNSTGEDHGDSKDLIQDLEVFPLDTSKADNLIATARCEDTGDFNCIPVDSLFFTSAWDYMSDTPAAVNDEDLVEFEKQPMTIHEIIAHEGPFEPTHPYYKGCRYKVLVHWSNGLKSFEPVSFIAKHDPGIIARYGQLHGLLQKPGWKRFKRVSKKRSKYKNKSFVASHISPVITNAGIKVVDFEPPKDIDLELPKVKGRIVTVHL